MEIKVVDEISPLSEYISRTFDAFLATPALYYTYDPSFLVIVKREGNIMTVNKRGSFSITDKRVLDSADKINEIKINNFVYDLEREMAIYNLELKRMLDGFTYFPPKAETFSSILIETSARTLKKIYKSSGNHSLMWAVKTMKYLPFNEEHKYDRLGIFSYVRCLCDYYGLSEINLRAVYERDIEGIENVVKEKHRLLSEKAIELNEGLDINFINDVNDYLIAHTKPLLTNIMNETGIPVTKEMVQVEMDLRIDGVEDVSIKNGEMYIKANLNKITSQVLIDTFGDDTHIIPTNMDDLDDEYSEFHFGY